MTAGWVKSLQCKTRAANDVVDTTSCRNSLQSLKDVVEVKKHKPRKQTPCQTPSFSRKSENNINRVNLRRSFRPPESYFPALTDLPVGHPSRNIVEIIFHTSWSPKVFSGRVEMVFKVQNLTRTMTRFEEYRELVKTGPSGSGQIRVGLDRPDHERCVADGNEVMRFQCLGPTGGGAYETEAWSVPWGKGAALCTFSGSGVAHESAGGGRGRKSMLVCRVIAGRVMKRDEFDSGYSGRVECDSVSGKNGELLVFDPRAVLPCFLIIYKL
ncbi:uncharacterized protein LOC143605062 [Bidens hawaiensis]|uniref:uncharacterized protein LOC143605062 n=1 Tax=Bidens hawaiensis TaxID=980011 RepID=UPI00404AEB3C